MARHAVSPFSRCPLPPQPRPAQVLAEFFPFTRFMPALYAAGPVWAVGFDGVRLTAVCGAERETCALAA